MSEDEILPVSVVALRAESYSPDGNVVISLRTAFSSPLYPRKRTCAVQRAMSALCQ